MLHPCSCRQIMEQVLVAYHTLSKPYLYIAGLRCGARWAAVLSSNQTPSMTKAHLAVEGRSPPRRPSSPPTPWARAMAAPNHGISASSALIATAVRRQE
uniref:Uncharacterized protein n=1 Tax=Arundo donax TaxID=35708 RepID=A0A0A9DVB9_ARUDO